jgi:hypothetical protein
LPAAGGAVNCQRIRLERAKRKEERGKRKEERGKRKEERGIGA